MNKILVANRGEIAVRIIRTCREMNIRTVAIYSTVDKDSLHVILADEAVCIGDHQLKNSYLNENAIIQAAFNTGAEAIHPGFGFLSETPSFARACEQAQLKFIGPSSELIADLGDKVKSHQLMKAAGVPVLPSSEGFVESVKDAERIAAELEFPVIIKASAGGGGRGMNICWKPSEVRELYLKTRQEAKRFFGNDTVYIEKYLVNPRHIEVQIIGDQFGNIVHMFDRECSVQRNNQKMIEEAPVQNITPGTKKRLYDVAVKAASHIGYYNAGTIEFIMDQNENFYFIEVNTRIQVEHPVTEMITNTDIVQEQIRIADSEKLFTNQSRLRVNGHSIELRINAEDPYDGFKAQTGVIESLHFPGGNGIRIDSAVYPGFIISPFYDSMIAKIIVHAPTREAALRKAIRCLEEVDIVGINTNIDFLLEILLSKPFQENTYNTSLVKELLG